jgi:ADP-ribosylglycohydrolase
MLWHWGRTVYYDLDELRRDYGEWITDYSDPKPGRYHSGLKAGQLSQAGIILKLTLRSLVECGRYDEADFCRRMDEELLPLLDGTLVGAQVGLSRIPQRFIDGLEDAADLCRLAAALAAGVEEPV